MVMAPHCRTELAKPAAAEILLLTNSNWQIYLFRTFCILFLDEIVSEVSLQASEGHNLFTMV